MGYLSKVARAESWLRYIVYHPRQIIVLVSLITLIFALQIPRLRLQTSIYDLIIEDLPETAQYSAFKEEFGCEEIILVVAKSKGIFQAETFRKIDRLAKELSEIKGVRRVVSLPGIKKAMETTAKWTLSDFERAISPVDLIQRNFISQDKNTTVISLVLSDVEEKDRVINATEELIDQYKEGLSLYQIGMPIVSKALADFTRLDFITLPAITFALIAVILYIFLGNLRGMLIPAGSVVIALVWTFGLMAWTGTPLSMLTMIVPIFLIAVGTAYCMYIFPEYLAALKGSDTPKEASLKCFLQLGFPTTLAVITTTIGLGSLLINKIHAIRQFAVFSCFGILCMLIIVLTFLPAVMAILPLPEEKPERGLRKKALFNKILSGIIRINLHHQKIALTLIGMVALLGIMGMSRIQVETNPVDFFKKDTYVAKNFTDIYQDMSGSFPLNVVLDSHSSDYFEHPANLKKIERLQGFLGSVEGVDKTISFADYLKLVNYATNGYEKELYALPEEAFEVRMLVNSYKTMLGEDVLKTFMNQDFSKVNIMLRTHISSSRDFLETQRKIETYLEKNFPSPFTFQVTGIGIVISHSSHLITEGQVKSLVMTLILVFAIMFLLFMSYKVGVIGMLPNCFPIIVSFGVMGWLGIPLSLATSLIASIAIGLAVDDTIHYLVCYNREFKKDLDKKRSLRETIQHIGRPIIFTTITISVGFSILMFSNFKPTAVFGLLMVITMFSALVADLILLPSLMLHVELVTIWDLLKLRLGKDPQKGIPLFDGLSRTQVHYILMAGALRTYEAGQVIMEKGELSDSMYVVISGELDVVNVSDEPIPDGTQRVIQFIARLKTGDVVGEMGMIRSCERSATVMASSYTELLQIDEKMIKRLQWLYPPTAHRFFFNLMGMLCDRLEGLTQSFLEATTVEGLTGLRTREYFVTVLEKEILRSRRYRIPLSLLMVSLDNFGEMNRVYGHQAANAILSDTATLLKQNVRRTDLICQYSVDKSALMLAHTSAKGARALVERIKGVLKDHCFRIGSDTLHVTATFGVVSSDPDSEKGVRKLIEDALQALKEAKEDP